MTYGEWERMPWRFGWKHEYWDGHARLTPRQHHAHVRLDIEARETGATALPPSARAPNPTDEQGLIHAFIDAFEDGVEFCDWSGRMIREHAERNITDYFAGRRGAPLLAASRLAVGDGRISGAALLNARDAGPNLDLLMVRPGLRRRGISRALVEAAVGGLRGHGTTGVLRSAYCVANEESASWHRAFGFEEEPDLQLAKLRWMFYAHEASRHEAGETQARLESSREHWNRRVEELEKVADREGFEAVTPALRYRWWA